MYLFGPYSFGWLAIIGHCRRPVRQTRDRLPLWAVHQNSIYAIEKERQNRSGVDLWNAGYTTIINQTVDFDQSSNNNRLGSRRVEIGRENTVNSSTYGKVYLLWPFSFGWLAIEGHWRRQYVQATGSTTVLTVKPTLDKYDRVKRPK